MKLKLLDLFSGIGGFSLGLESTGFFETIGFVEKDKFCQKVLKKHWHNINIEEDIRNVKGERYAADIITGGFPCQPFSVAGKRKSTADDRYLWDEMLRVIREVKPRWVIGENVEGIVNINEGMVLRQVLNDLENEGFKSQCIIIPASGIGAWHQRKRIWIVANSSSQRSSSQSIGEHRELDKEIKRKKETRDQSTLCTSSSCSDVSNSESSRCGGWSSKECSNREWSFLPRKQQGCEMGSEVKGCDRNVSNSNGEGSQGYKLQHDLETGKQISEHNGKTSFERQQTWWQTQSEFCGVPNGVSYELDKDRSNRIKSLGNSIVPQIARQIGLSIMEAELNGKI
jgi:DNA (cytosine-5)-methyltransferase 1